MCPYINLDYIYFVYGAVIKEINFCIISINIPITFCHNTWYFQITIRKTAMKDFSAHFVIQKFCSVILIKYILRIIPNKLETNKKHKSQLWIQQKNILYLLFPLECEKKVKLIWENNGRSKIEEIQISINSQTRP